MVPSETLVPPEVSQPQIHWLQEVQRWTEAAPSRLVLPAAPLPPVSCPSVGGVSAPAGIGYLAGLSASSVPLCSQSSALVALRHSTTLLLLGNFPLVGMNDGHLENLLRSLMFVLDSPSTPLSGALLLSQGQMLCTHAQWWHHLAVWRRSAVAGQGQTRGDCRSPS